MAHRCRQGPSTPTCKRSAVGAGRRGEAARCACGARSPRRHVPQSLGDGGRGPLRRPRSSISASCGRANSRPRNRQRPNRHRAQGFTRRAHDAPDRRKTIRRQCQPPRLSLQWSFSSFASRLRPSVDRYYHPRRACTPLGGRSPGHPPGPTPHPYASAWIAAWAFSFSLGVGLIWSDFRDRPRTWNSAR